MSQISFSSMSDEIKLKIVSFLDVKSICTLGKVNREIKDLTKNDLLWKDIFQSHFSKIFGARVNDITPSNKSYLRTYKNNYLKLKKLLKRLPQPRNLILLEKHLSTFLSGDLSFKEKSFEIFFHNLFAAYVESLHPSEIKDLVNAIPVDLEFVILLKSLFLWMIVDLNSENSRVDIMKSILKKFPNFKNEIKCNDDYGGVNYTFSLVAGIADIDSMNFLIENFSSDLLSLGINDSLGVGRAFYHAAVVLSDFDAAKLIIDKFPKIKEEINISEEFGLGHIFCELGKSQLQDPALKIMQLIIDRFPRFIHEVDINGEFGLGRAFCSLTVHKNDLIMKLFIEKVPRFFSEINLYGKFGLKRAHMLAICRGHVKQLNLIGGILFKKIDSLLYHQK